MKKLVLSFLVVSMVSLCVAQSRIEYYSRQTFMIPMRDGIKLFTAVLTPNTMKEPLPILIQRTPYGAQLPERIGIINV